MSDNLIKTVIEFDDTVRGIKVECKGDGFIKVIDTRSGREEVSQHEFTQEIHKALLNDFINKPSANADKTRRMLAVLGFVDGRGGIRTNAGRKATGKEVAKNRSFKMYEDEYEKLKRLGGVSFIRQQMNKFD